VTGSSTAVPSEANRSRPPSRSFRSDVGHSLATNVVVALLGLTTGVLVARLLRPPGRGDLAAIFNTPTLLSVLASLGLSESLVYYTARQRERAGRYLGTSLVLAFAASLVFAAAGWLLMPLLLAEQSAGTVTAARWYLLQVPIGAVLGIAAAPLRGKGDIKGWNYLKLSHSVVWLMVLLGAIVHGHPQARSLSLAFVLGRLALVPFTFVVVRYRMRRTIKVDVALARPLLRFGVPNMLSVLPNVLNLRLDQMLMAAFLPNRDLGLYVVAVSWSQLPAPALLALGTVLFPRVAAADDADRAELAARGMRMGTLLSVVLGLATLPLTPIGIPFLFRGEYRDAVPVALVLVFAAAASSTNTIQQEAIRGLGQPNLVLRSQLYGLAVTVACLAALLGPFGMMGAAIASLLGYLTIAGALAIHGSRLTGLSIAALTLPRRGDVRALVDQLLVAARRPARKRAT
jgi:O-antigen/teichoic acid export membrane protein